MHEAAAHQAAAADGRNQDALRASHDDREQVIGTLKTAFMQGRLTEEELGERAGQVYGSRTYAELAGVTADIPGELTGPTGARSRRDPWRATKIAWRIEYAVFLPGIVALLLIPGGPRTTPGEVLTLTAVVYFLFWTLGVAMMVTSQPARPALMALAQGRLTEEERDERSALVPASRCWADLDALIADLPAGLANQPPKARDVRTGLGVSAAAASVLAAIMLWQPDNPVAFLLGLLAAAVLVVAPVITVGLWADVRHQKRPRRQGQVRRRDRSRRRRPA
jgi:uncharacterized membrane protein YedE/YeeE